MLCIAMAIAFAFGAIVVSAIDKNGETLEISLFLVAGIPFLFLIAFLTGPGGSFV